MISGPFIFERYAYDNASGVLRLRYKFEGGPTFEEKIVFPPATRKMSHNDLAALDASFRLIFLMAGVSYYKAYASEQLLCPAFSLDETTAAFVEKTYRKGLAEFAYTNRLKLQDRIHFKFDAVQPRRASPLDLPRHSLVPVGGGKDSIVALETLKESKEPITLFALGAATGIAQPIEDVIKLSGLPALRVARTLAPNLSDMNRAGAYNGHVPITAILSTIAIATSILHGFNAIIFANEHSASSPNLWMNDAEINHQYSKSFDFENDLSSYVTAHIAPDLQVFSLLRPYSEAEIARRFARYKDYFPIFRSCNKAFKQDAAARAKNWCCDCPKCRFVFLALAPFVAKDKLIDIFGGNMLNDPKQMDGFAELCGLSKHKPFECVGEVGESALLMEKLYRSDDWKNDTVVADLGKKLPQSEDFERLYHDLFSTRGDHNLEETYLRMLDASR